MKNKLKKLKLDAMKSGDKFASTLYSVVLGEIQLVESKKDLTDDQAVKIVQKFRQSCWDNYTKFGVETGKAEAELLDAILPKMMSRDELAIEIEIIINDGLISDDMSKNVGRCTGVVNKILKGKDLNFNGRDVKSILDEVL